MAASYIRSKQVARPTGGHSELRASNQITEESNTTSTSGDSETNGDANLALIYAQVRQLAAETSNRKLRALLRAAETAEDRFRGLVEAAPDAVVIIDRSGHISLINRQAEAMFGYDRTELLGNPVEVLVPDCYRELHTVQRQRYTELSHTRPMGTGLEMVGRRRDGSEFPTEISLSAIPGQIGMHIVATIRDVSERKRIEFALKESERFVRSTFDALPAHICVLDETGTIVSVNKAWRTFAVGNGANPKRTGEGVNYLAVCDAAVGEGAAEAQAFAANLRALLRGERDECDIEYPSQSSTGWHWYMCRATRFPADGPVRCVVVHEDITEVKRAELALRKVNKLAEAAQQKEAERRHEAERRRHISESLRDVMLLLNSERPLGDVLEYIASQANLLLGSQAVGVYRSGDDTELVLIQAGYGYVPGAMNRNTIHVDLDALRQTIPARGAIAIQDVPRTLADMSEWSVGDESPAFSIPVLDGCSALVAVPILIKDEVYGGLVLYYDAPRAFSHDEIELATMFADQATLAIENARLKEQATQAAAASERNRLARDLHDAVTQAIFSANLIADALPQVWERDPQEGRRGLAQLRQLTRGALAELRTLLFELRPAALLDKPLPDLLRQLTEAMANRSRVAITFEAKGTCTVPPAVHVALYRIAQEALNNVTKHAEARQVTVLLRCSPRRLVLRIQDDGRGFDVSAVKADHLGTAIMRERARSIGATCRLVSQVGSGTQVVVSWSAATSSAQDRLPSPLIAPPATRHPARQQSQL